MMRNKRGLTLIELLVAVVLTAVIGLTVVRMLQTMQRSSTGQLQQVDMQSNVRSAALAVPTELREIGYDSLITFIPAGIDAIESDLEEIQATRVRFRASRGMGIYCELEPSETVLRIARPLFAHRDPAPEDTFLIFTEREKLISGDDQWLPLPVASIDPNSTCGGRPALALTLTAPNKINGGVVIMGAPVRYFETMEYGLMVTGGRAWLGARSISKAEVNLTPVLGPLQNPGGFSLRYFDNNGLEVAAGGDPRLVRRVEITLNGETEGRVSLAGATQSQPGAWRLVTQVTLRNTLRQ